MKHTLLSIFLILLVSALASQAQQALPASGSGNTSGSASGSGDPQGTPIDVPDIIIKGNATIKLMATSFSKQSPSSTRVLTRQELDSLNNLEKQAPRLLARSETPSGMAQRGVYAANFRASMGLFQSPDVFLSYATTLHTTALYAQGYYNSSAGFIDNAGYQRAGLLLNARYFDASTDGFLSGAHHEGTVLFDSHHYKLYAQSDSISERQGQRFTLDYALDDLSSESPYSARIHFGSSNVDQTVFRPDQLRETAIGLDLSFGHRWDDWLPSILVHADLRPTHGQTIADNSVVLQALRRDSSFSSSIAVGLALHGNSSGTTSAEPVVDLQAAYAFSQTTALQLRLRRQSTQDFYSDLLELNPYLNLRSVLEARTSIGAELSCLYRLKRSIEASASIGYRSYTAYGMFVMDSLRQFLLHYGSASVLSAQVNGYLHLSNTSSVSALLRFQQAVDDSSATLPYESPLEIRIQYQADIVRNLPMSLHLSYMGTRRVSTASSTELSSYFNLGADLKYFFADNLSVTARVDNLTNSSIFVYDKYRERGAFASLGLEYKF